METPRRNRMDLNTPAELAIYNAMQEVEKIGADQRLTNAVIALQEAKNLVADFIDGNVERLFHYYERPEFKPKKQFLLLYHLSRRSDEGWGRLNLVSASSLDEAKKILDEKVTYHYIDALASEMIHPDTIECLNID